MKINPEKIIIDNKDLNFNKKIFLISGNEETLIKKIEEVIITVLKKENFIFVEKSSEKIVNEKTLYDESEQLFSNKKIKIYEDPKEVDEVFVNQLLDKNISILIIHKKIGKFPKIKRFFDNHKDFASINCYPITGELKKKFFNSFLNINKITLDQDAYWFFLENTAEEYIVFENEMKKLLCFENEKVSLTEMTFIISNFQKKISDSLFFLIITNKKQIVLETQKVIRSQEDVYFLLARAKFFFDLIVASSNTNDALLKFPKYLFREKLKFKELYLKTNRAKNIKILTLLKKSELLIRKHSGMHLSIAQRLLLNINNILK